MEEKLNMAIEVKNWDEYNPKNFKIRYRHWFRMDHAVINSRKVYELSFEERWLWITLLCLASEKNDPIVKFTPRWLAMRSNLKPANVGAALVRLAESGLVEMLHGQESDIKMAEVCQKNGRSLPEKQALQDRQTIQYSPDPEPSVPETDFSRLILEAYEFYPRKEARSAGLRRLKNQLKAPEDVARFKCAVKNFAKAMSREGREKRHIKIFSSFCDPHCWVDWVEEQKTQSIAKKVFFESELAKEHG